MLLANNLDELEQERAQMWELFALLLDFRHGGQVDFNYQFTAKELAKQTEYTKSELNKLLFRLHLQKAVLMHAKTPNGATIYKLNKSFLTEQNEQYLHWACRNENQTTQLKRKPFGLVRAVFLCLNLIPKSNLS